MVTLGRERGVRGWQTRGHGGGKREAQRRGGVKGLDGRKVVNKSRGRRLEGGAAREVEFLSGGRRLSEEPPRAL